MVFFSNHSPDANQKEKCFYFCYHFIFFYLFPFIEGKHDFEIQEREKRKMRKCVVERCEKGNIFLYIL